jgi:poly-beta-hydroxyalkanoate depolymerase
MDAQTTHNLTEAIKPWLSDAIAHIRPHREQWAEVVKCMNSDGDMRIVFYVRVNAFTVEAEDYREKMVTEVFRQQLVPANAGFALTDSATAQ